MPTRKINEFYNVLKNTGAFLTHQFQLNVISNAGGEIDNALKDITMWASGAALPGRTQNVASLSFRGYPLKVPTNFTMTQQMQLTVNCDAALYIRNAFFAWQSLFSNPDIAGGSNGGGQKTIPTAKIILDLLDHDLETVMAEYHLHGVIPTNVGDVSLANENPGIGTFSLSLDYQYWDYVAKSGKKASLSKQLLNVILKKIIK